MAKQERIYLNVGENIDEKKPLTIRIYPSELSQMVEKKLVEKADATKDVGQKILAKLGIKPEARKGRGISALKVMKDELDMTPTNMAKAIINNPTLMAEFKKIAKQSQ
jgi:hypothetical protein